MSKHVLGVYHSKDEVIQAIEEVQNEGYSVNDLSILANTRDFPYSIQNETGVSTEDLGEAENTRTYKEKGFFENLFSALEVNTTSDHNEISYYDHLVGLGFDNAAARDYEKDLNSGKILLLVDSGTGTFTAPSAGGITGTSVIDQTTLDTDTLGTNKERSLKLREEQLDVTKERVQTGEVEVRKDVVEEQKTVHVPVTHEEVYVERRTVGDAAIDDTAAATTKPIGDEETIRVPIVEEKVEVTKKPVVTEELVIGKRQATETEQVTENIKREEARVETDGDATVDETTIDRNRLNEDRL
ncbi:YsnF/AvaK domain-containing protein [Metabacillus sediminilitoris]|uniref:YsnF/AvaK domain-containing protein n=1 Tax=Metabacillus sediminilitoris TaxID=2567941 RepID=A0A4S4BU92_9BACI|nr:YsnF/AvaK domain-containing protein [Metabacillus sediminilitoris]QGQ45032.1 YsnF/AvaK domain-containing protein [Metabacillus sediminilitoris]THF78664.1 YsnF/AvaK domain-containing protein [Metabacillus sediminilitoris]